MIGLNMLAGNVKTYPSSGLNRSTGKRIKKTDYFAATGFNIFLPDFQNPGVEGDYIIGTAQVHLPDTTTVEKWTARRH